MITVEGIKYNIGDFLIGHEIYPNKAGYNYLVESIFLVIGIKYKELRIVKNIYGKVATKYGVKVCAVERDIRYALKRLNLESYSAAIGENMEKIPSAKIFIFKTSRRICEMLGIR